MDDLANILREFTVFIEKSAAVMPATTPSTTPGGSTEQAGQTGVVAQAGQPTVRINETNAISTQPSPQLAMTTNKAPTSNAAPKQLNFNSFSKK